MEQLPFPHNVRTRRLFDEAMHQGKSLELIAGLGELQRQAPREVVREDLRRRASEAGGHQGIGAHVPRRNASREGNHRQVAWNC